ncbi:MAG: hypothetical protein EP330_02125 [Deltaproteobacteria bacterium]|nr:MAG: hypothetical protein EP330_02125 [Deltaproteobacteria bacterium]
MTRIAMLAMVALPLAQGCIIYNADGWNDDWDDGDWDPLVDEEPAPTDTAVDVNPLGLYLDPPSIDAGGMGIISLRGAEGVDLSEVASVEFHGEVAVHALQARANEAVLSIGAGAETGFVDATVTFADGEAYWLVEALEVLSTDETDTGLPCD